MKDVIAAELGRARQGTETLLAPLSDDELVRQVSPIQSPLVWDYAHIAYFEELWLLREVGGVSPLDSLHDDVYDAFRHARATRSELPILDPPAARAYAADIRERTLDVLDRVDLEGGDPLLDKGYVFGMVLQHELQHQETMLQTLQLRDELYPVPERPSLEAAVPGAAEITVPAGPFVMGASDEPWAYDNEREAHTVELPTFHLDRTPVTNARYLDFVADGGYDSPRVWSAEGWAWRQTENALLPLGWRQTADGVVRMRFGQEEQLPPDEPVQHVSWFEADAFARWAGKRLPTEQEWEKAARWSPGAPPCRYPWGSGDPSSHANLGHVSFGPLPAREDGASACGALQLAGDVWEWTSSHFLSYPGFHAFPYAEYSEVFFGDEYRVLRGGSWATDPLVARSTFRNWDYPKRRQIFAGFRCARDA